MASILYLVFDFATFLPFWVLVRYLPDVSEHLCWLSKCIFPQYLMPILLHRMLIILPLLQLDIFYLFHVFIFIEFTKSFFPFLSQPNGLS